MKVKQSIYALFLLLGVSFSANASKIYKVNRVTATISTCPLSVGDYVDSSFLSTCVGGTFNNKGVVQSAYVYMGSYFSARHTSGGHTYDNTFASVLLINKCPNGLEVNPDTYKCEKPKVPFCKSQEFQDILFEYAKQCPGQEVDYQCIDENNYSVSCKGNPEPPCDVFHPDYPDCGEPTPPPQCDENSPDYPNCCVEENNWCDLPPCEIGQPHWPDCMPTDPNPDIPENPEIPNPTPTPSPNPTDPTAPIDQPPVEDNPSDGDNENLINAIEQFNKDSNELLTKIHNEAAKDNASDQQAFKDMNDELDAIKSTSIDNTNSLLKAFDGQNQLMADIGSQTNSHLMSLASINKHGFSDVVDAIEDIGMIQEPNGMEAPALYSPDALTELNTEIDALKAEYEQIVTDFKNYFQMGSLNNGEFNPHTLHLNWRGNVIEQDNLALKTLVENSEVIASIILFIAGFLGVRIILEEV